MDTLYIYTIYSHYKNIIQVNIIPSAVYLAGFLTYKYSNTDLTIEEEGISCEFITELNRGGLHVPTLSNAYFVQNAINIHNNIDFSRKKCITYFQKLLSFIDFPMAENNMACKSLTNILFKAYCVNVCDTEKQMGCLRRKEKLSS